jgi:hypothetical protein
MAKFNVSLSGTFQVKSADEAKDRLFEIYQKLEQGEDIQEGLLEDEAFDFNVGVNEYGNS